MALVTWLIVAEKDPPCLFERIFEGITFEALKVPVAAEAVALVRHSADFPGRI
jgi:hypothetical protein